MLRKRLTIGTWAVGLLLAFSGGTARAQWSLDGGGEGFAPSRTNWERRMVRAPREQSTAPATTRVVESGYDTPSQTVRTQYAEPRAYSGQASQPYRRSTYGAPANYRRVAAEEPSALAPEAMGTLEPIGPGQPIDPGQPIGGDIGYEYGAAGCGVDGGPCYDDCGECYGGCGLDGSLVSYILRNASLFAGVHGFKGPVDQGRNGNFGIHEGFNFGAPLSGVWDWGYQIGFTAVQSNFSGDQTYGSRRGDRDQYFLTFGLFKRAPCGGFQWAFAYDLQHDMYYSNAVLEQLRQETSFVLPNGNEIGYFGVYGLDGATYRQSAQNALRFDPTDMYALFIRRHFELGGEGRLWGGVSGWGDGVFGADLRMPLGKSWAIENRLTYLVPKEGRGMGGQAQESWGLAIQIVWYPGRSAACEGQNPFRPILNVADNSSFIVTSRHR